MPTFSLAPSNVMSNGGWTPSTNPHLTVATLNGSYLSSPSGGAGLSFSLAGLPADVGTLSAFTVYFYGVRLQDGLAFDDVYDLAGYVFGGGRRIAGADSSGTIQTAAPTVTARAGVGETQTVSIQFNWVDPTATRADWDLAEVWLQSTRLANMGGDDDYIQVDQIRFDGTYTPATLPILSGISGGTYLDLSWNQIAGSTDYSLERSLNGTSGWARINPVGTALSYRDTNVTTGSTYYYRVNSSLSGTNYSAPLAVKAISTVSMFQDPISSSLLTNWALQGTVVYSASSEAINVASGSANMADTVEDFSWVLGEELKFEMKTLSDTSEWNLTSTGWRNAAGDRVFVAGNFQNVGSWAWYQIDGGTRTLVGQLTTARSGFFRIRREANGDITWSHSTDGLSWVGTQTLPAATAAGIDFTAGKIHMHGGSSNDYLYLQSVNVVPSGSSPHQGSSVGGFAFAGSSTATRTSKAAGAGGFAFAGTASGATPFAYQEGDRINQIHNPSFEVDLAGWEIWDGAIARTTALASVGSACLELTADGTGNPGFQTPVGLGFMEVTPGVPNTFSVRVRPDTTARSYNFYVQYWDASGGNAGNLSTGVGTGVVGAWTTLSLTVTAGATAAYSHVRVTVNGPGFDPVPAGEKHFFDALMLEASSTADAYFDGSTAPASGFQHLWAGTAHNSPSIQRDAGSAGVAAGTFAWAGAATGVTPVIPPPPVPTGLTVTAASGTQADVSWNASEGASSYDLERNGVIVLSGHTSTTYSDTGLTPGTEYTYRVRAVR